MSSRALRRLQREQEEARLAQSGELSEEEEEELPQRPVKKSAFDLLNSGNDDESDREDEDDDDEPPPSTQQDDTEPVEVTPKASKKSKKKKKKNKSRSKTAESAAPEDPELDEIDRALQSLGTQGTQGKASGEERPAEDLLRFYSLLSINRTDLNSLNEMKKLFGSAVLQTDDDEDEQNQRRPRGAHQINMEQMLSARYNRASKGQGLSGLALRQNVFMAGKASWPKLPSGGLGMEVVEKLDDFTIEYRFLHKPEYQRAQKKFEDATRTLQADAIMNLVVQQPYHIATLLQMGEILKQQGDHSLAGDLYERALYNFGRSVQSTFGTSLAEGKARMDFRRPENREFWLTTWRYIGTLVQRGTLRTAYEWAKLLLSLDPEGIEGDPYRIRLIIDQLALRGGQFQHLIDLASTNMSLIDWGQDSPNIRISLGLAHWRLKEMQEAEDTLTTAVKDFPWVFARLFQQLDIEKSPPSIWGAKPRTPFETLETESYAIRAKDIWNTPETLAFLRKAVESAPKGAPEAPKTQSIGLNEARHVLVSDIPQLISTLPREFTTMQTTSSDPLPPPDTVLDYVTTATEADLDEELNELEAVVHREAQEGAVQGGGGGITGFLASAINRFLSRDAATPISDDDLQRARTEARQAVSDADRQSQNLGDELGLETVTVRTPEEYSQVMERGQFPVVAEDAVEEFNRRLNESQGNGRIEAEQQRAQQAAVEERARQAQENEQRRQLRHATVEDDEDDAVPVAPQPSAPTTEVYDEDANKRWLAGRGMLALKDFVAQRGSDEQVWKSGGAEATKVPKEYADRVVMLRNASNRAWILDFALKQGAGAEASAMMKRLLAAGWGGR